MSRDVGFASVNRLQCDVCCAYLSGLAFSINILSCVTVFYFFFLAYSEWY